MSTDVHTLSGAYALHALSKEEAAEFERHLAGCATCRAEVDEFSSVTAQLAELEPEVVPARLKEAVLRAADAQRQLPPVVTLDQSTRSPGVPVGDVSDPEGAEGSSDEVATVVPINRPTRWARALVAAAAAIALVVGVGYGIDRATFDQPLAASAAQVFEAPDARHVDMQLEDGGTVAMATAPSTGQVAVDTRGLNDPGEGRVYQLWTVTEGTALSAGVLDEGGTALRMPTEGTMLAITVEPAGGSSSPTMPIVLEVDPTTV